jgi:hypothetical protein
MELVGLVVIVIGLALISIPLAIIIGGIMLTGVGYLREMQTLSQRENDNGTSEPAA